MESFEFGIRYDIYIEKKLSWNYTHLHGHSKTTENCQPHEHLNKPLSEILLIPGYVIATHQLGQQIFIYSISTIDKSYKKILADEAQANHNNFSKKHPLSFRVA